MRYSKLFGKTIKEIPGIGEAINHRLLVKAGFIDQLMAGVFSFLPLGWCVHRKIEEIIRQEMNAIGSQEVFLPTLQKKEQWLETKRWDTMEPPLFKFEDRHGRELALGPTHEEIMTDLVRRFIHSYKDLPLALYQIQNKFRNEMRSTGGLLRVREFVMKDLYSFHANEQDLASFFEKVKQAYVRIFNRCELSAIPSQASGGTIGGTTTYEFQVPSPTGEDKVLLCKKCNFAVNLEAGLHQSGETCPECKNSELEETPTIEVGHIFNLGTEYSEKMGATFTTDMGEKKYHWMGCYGIGLGRLMAAIVEVHHDEEGIVWPKEVAPYQVHLVNLVSSKFKIQNSALTTEQIYENLKKAGIGVLYDDRNDVSAGEKFADADLIGCPYRLVVSEGSLGQGGVEVKKRNEERTEVVNQEKLLEFLRKKVV